MVSWSGLATRIGTDERQLRLAGIAVALVAAVALAGCAGIGGSGGGQSVSDAQVTVAEDTSPAVVFNYSVNDYATVLLEGPNDNIIKEREVSPEGNQSGLYMGDPEPGEYELVLRQGEETIDSQTLTFEGTDPTVEDVSPRWSGGTVESMSVTVRNDGDLPVYVNNVTASARGDSMDSSVYEWVDVGDSRTFNVTSSFSSTISVSEAGNVDGSVEVNTESGTLGGSFSTTFAGPNLQMTEVNDSWSSSDLQTVYVTVQNDGDLPTDAKVSVLRGDETLASTFNETLPAGSSVTFEVESVGYIYRAESGGSVSLDVVADSPNSHATDTISREIEGASVSIQSINPVWENGELTEVTATVANDGEVEAQGTIELEVAGESVTSSSFRVEPGATGTVDVWGGYQPAYTAERGGPHDVTVSISGDGWTDSRTSTTDLGSLDGDISSVSPTFLSNYDENTSDLTSLTFNIQNTGDIPLSYDSVEVTIDGSAQTLDSSSITAILPGEQSSEYVSTEITVSNGDHEVTVRLMNDGEAIVTDTATVST